MIVHIKSLEEFRPDTHVISNMSPSEDIALPIIWRRINPHSLHGPDTCDAECAEGSEKIFLVDGDAVGFGVVIFGAKKTDSDLAVEHTDSEGRTESDPRDRGHVVHDIENHLRGFKETTIGDLSRSAC